MRLTLSTRLVTLVAGAALALASTAPALAQSDAAFPVDTELTVVSIDGAAPPAGVVVTATFGSDGTVSGTGGCNQYSAGYELDGGSIAIGPPRSTKMACEYDQMQTEFAYLSGLEASTSWSADASGLTLTSDDGGEIVFSTGLLPVEGQLTGIDWVLVSLDGEAVPAGVVTTLLLGEDLIASGNAGCNQYSGAYSYDDLGDIVFGELGSTMMMCDPEAMDVETRYLTLLRSAAHWFNDGGQLHLTDAAGAGELLFAQGAGSPVGQTWTLVTLSGEEVPAGVTTTLTLDAEGNASGNAGCNQYGGGYELSGSSISFGEVGSTKMMCEEPAMGVETAYLAALATVDAWAMEGDTLTLSAAGEPILVFTDQGTGASAGGSELVGTTWVLTGIAGMPMLSMGEPPTVVFDAAGTVSGTGGCNQYSGEYSVDGGSISIGELASTMMACTDMMAMAFEQAFVPMLPVMTGWAIEDGVLTLTGPAPGLTMTFEAAAE